MESVETELESFSQFVTTQIDSGAARLTLDELFDLWRQTHPLDNSKAEDDVAIAASIEDVFARDRRRVRGPGQPPVAESELGR